MLADGRILSDVFFNCCRFLPCGRVQTPAKEGVQGTAAMRRQSPVQIDCGWPGCAGMAIACFKWASPMCRRTVRALSRRRRSRQLSGGATHLHGAGLHRRLHQIVLEAYPVQGVGQASLIDDVDILLRRIGAQGAGGELSMFIEAHCGIVQGH